MIKENKGFSLIELVIVIAVFLILIIFGLPRFIQFIEMARFRIAGLSLVESYKRCRAYPESTPIIPNIPKVSYQYQTCNDSMSASINDNCSLEIDLVTGEKGEWPKTYKECTENNKTQNKEENIAFNSNIFPRDENGNVYFDERRGLYDNGHQCDASFGMLDKLNDSKKGDNEQPQILVSPESYYWNNVIWPSGRSSSNTTPECVGVRIPASFFDDGILPKPFEVKKAKRIMSSGLKSSSSVDAIYFDDQGRPIMMISPKEFEVDQEAWDAQQRQRWWGTPRVDPLERENLWGKMRANNPEIDWDDVFEGIQ